MLMVAGLFQARTCTAREGRLQNPSSSRMAMRIQNNVLSYDKKL